MRNLLLSIVGLVVSILLHKTILALGIQVKLSFTISMIIPYVIEFFFIASITFQLYNKLLSEKNMLIRRLVGLTVLLGGCGIAFAAHPIYDGDFNHTYREITLKGNSESTFKPGLTMVVLPGCPFCYERLEEMKMIQNIHPDLPIYVLVIQQDTISRNDYQEVAGEGIEVDFFPNALIPTLQIQGYPSMYYMQKNGEQPIINWSNQGFGSAAWDYVLKQNKITLHH